MIKLILDKTALHDFYIKEIIPKLDNLFFNSKFNIINRYLVLYKAFYQYDPPKKINDFIHDLLLLSPNDLIKKNKVIYEYCRLVLFCFYFKTKKNRINFCRNNKKILGRLFDEKIRQELNSDFFYELILNKIKNNPYQNKNCSFKELFSIMDCFFEEATKICDKINNQLTQHINYNILDDNLLRKRLYKLFNVRVCPYCNQQYIFSVSQNSYLGDFDHFLPKSIFPLFSLSLWNLVPCCKTCNQVYKGNRLDVVVNPHLCGFYDNFGLNLVFYNVKSILGRNSDFDVSFQPFRIQSINDLTTIDSPNNYFDIFFNGKFNCYFKGSSIN